MAKTKPSAKQRRQGITRLAEMQVKLYAPDQWGVLLVFQAMDAAGKDGAIKHLMSGVNPQGCQVFAFKSPTNEEPAAARKAPGGQERAVEK